MNKQKILFLPAGIGIAHTGRCVVLARELKKRGYEIFFGVGKHSQILLENENLPFKIIPEVSWDSYENKFRKMNASLFSVSMIEKFVRRECKLINEVKADIIIADARPTARISSLLTGKPLVSLVNVEGTRYYDLSKVRVNMPLYWRSILPEVIKKVTDSNVSKSILKKITPFVLKLITADQLLKFNLVLIKNKLKPKTDYFDFLMGDKTFLVDIPIIKPVKQLPSNVTVVGPIFWEGQVSNPIWTTQLVKTRPLIYLTASGTGDAEIIQKLINYLKDSPYQVVVTLGNVCKAKVIDIPKKTDLYIEQFLPGSFIMPRADLIIYPGGASTSYQALNYGVPQIGIPVNLDQEDTINQLVRLKTALAIDPYSELNKKNVLYAIEKILNNDSYKKNTLKIREIMLQYNGPRKAADTIESHFKQLNFHESNQ